jgi:hypothetical protein
VSQQINLFNPRFRRQKNYFTAAVLAGAVGVALLVSLLTGVLAAQRASRLQAETAVLKSDLAAREARRAAAAIEFAPRARSTVLAQELARAEQENRALRDVSNVLGKGDIGNVRGYSAYFQAFARSSVNGLWLTGVQISGPGREIGLQGRALQASLLPGYLQGLSREPVLKGTSFGRLEMGQPKTTEGVKPAAPAPYVEFSLQATPASDPAARKETR